MSLNVNGKQCPICHGYLFEEDDVVYCPICGAPHHRDCYKTVGHCGFESLHGTEHQYDASADQSESKGQQETADQAPNQVKCPSCGTAYAVDETKCPGCGMPNSLARISVMGVDPLGGVKRDEPVGKDVTAEEAARFVMLSTTRYIPKFLAFFRGKKTSFNLWSFFFPTAQFAGRKMYAASFLCGLVELAGLLLCYPLSLWLVNQNLTGYQQMYEALATAPFATVGPLLYLTLGGAFVLLLLRIICGLFADRFYYRYVLNRLEQIRTVSESDADKNNNLRRFGGFNIFSFILALVLLQYLPGIISFFIL